MRGWDLYNSMHTMAIRTFTMAEISKALTLVLILLWGCSDKKTQMERTPDTVATSRPGDDAPEPKNDTVAAPSRTPADLGENIRVAAPRPGDTVLTEIQLSGTARTFENNVPYRLFTANDSLIAQGFTTAMGDMGSFNPYAAVVTIKTGYSGPARLEVFQASMDDGRITDRVSIPIVITTRENRRTQAATMPLNVYFSNVHRGSSDDCRLVFALQRQVRRTPAAAEAAMAQLLKGPTADELEKGYRSQIPGGARLRNITIVEGVATADFNTELNHAAGSCSVTAIRSQIESTLRQFPTVQSVVILVEGKSEGVLQP